jgi:alpha-2-macroglobulin
MLSFVRASLISAVVALLTVVAAAVDKPFQRDELNDSAIKLEAEIKSEAGSVTKPLAALRREADAAFERRDFRAGMQALGQIVAVAPNEAAAWLRLSRAVLQVRPANDEERATLNDRATTAAYIAYQRAGNAGEEAEALTVIGRAFAARKTWRPALDALRLSLELRETADIRALYEGLRAEHGFRVLDYSVDSDAASPRACFQFSEALAGKRTDFSPFIALAGDDKPAITTDDQQLCVEGLKHGERYSVTLRAGLPSAVVETLQRSADFSIYVRDRKPMVHFAGRAYVLPRSGQRGIPVVSVNTDKVLVKIFRIGDRSLVDTVLGSDFQRNLDRYELTRLADERGAKVWEGELKVEPQLNADVTTAFPVGEAVGDLKPGVYVMTADTPGPHPDDDYGSIATQWFVVSDLGLTAYSGGDGIVAWVHSLASAEPKAGVELRLVARNNEILATRTSDAAGMVRFEPGLARGEGGLSPAMLVGGDSGDYAFLNLKGPAFDLSDRGVSGRPAPSGLDAFVYTERGVYRSGETVHVAAILRDSAATAVADLPLTLTIERPDGVEYRRAVVADAGFGGRTLDVPIVASAPTGTWRVRAFTDPKRPPVGQASFLVEDYVPDRLEFALASPAGRISRAAPAEVTVDGRYLYGAPASGLELEGELGISASRERPGLPGYQFGLADEEVSAEREPLADLPTTDAMGKARFTVPLAKVPASSQPLSAEIVVRMSEPGGRAVERTLTLPVAPSAPMIGVKPLFTGQALADGDMASFDVMLVAPDGASLARKGLQYQLLRIESRYQWYRQEGRWEWEAVKSTARVADGRIDVEAGRPGRIAVPVTTGRYRLEVAVPERNGPVTSIAFDAGYYAEASGDTPDVLEMALDKSAYAAGDTLDVAVTARSAGKLTVAVVGERLLATSTAEVTPGVARVPLTVGSDWGTGAYVVATLRRPLDVQAGRMPGRAIGVGWFSVDRAKRSLSLDLKAPNAMRPGTALRLPVKVDGLAPGEEARLIVAAVDVGILNLTNYQPPAPDDYYLGQRRLGTELRDLYGQLIDGMQGARGSIRTGGDVGAELSGAPPSGPPVALFSGVVTVAPDGTADVSFDIPAFAGTLRVMAIGWTRDKVGHASADVIVRDPVVLTSTVPRFLLMGDRGTLRVDLDNVEGQAGDYRVAAAATGPLKLDAPGRTLALKAGERSGLSLPLAATGVGTGTVGVTVTGPGGLRLERSFALTVKPSTQVLARRTVKPLAAGESVTLSSDLFADFVPGTGTVALSVGPSTALDVAALVKELDHYPFGCSEQVASKLMPLIYLDELAAAAKLDLDPATGTRVRDSIDRILARQGGNGSFGLWSAGGDDAWLDAYVTDVLSRARERGFVVPDTAFRLALDRLRNLVAAAPEPTKDGGRDLAYALYVLARNGAAPIGDLRYLADTRLGDLATPIAKAQVAAALAMLGDRARAERAYAAALEAIAPQPKLEPARADYGSSLRDAAALLTLAAEGHAPQPILTSALRRVEAARGLTTSSSTQEKAWMVLAARALGKEAGAIALEVNGEPQKGAVYRNVSAADVGRGFKVTNTGSGELQAVITASGAPVMPEPAAEKGFRIERLYYSLDGTPAEVAQVRQNQRFVVLLRMTEPKPQFGRVIVADPLPAGFEIDNPRLVSSGETGTLSWIEDAAEPVHSEFRDDRFVAAFDRKAEDPAVFTVAYVVRAVSPGRYVLPQAAVEDMYRPDRFGRTGTGSVEVQAAR